MFMYYMQFECYLMMAEFHLCSVKRHIDLGSNDRKLSENMEVDDIRTNTLSGCIFKVAIKEMFFVCFLGSCPSYWSEETGDGISVYYRKHC